MQEGHLNLDQLQFNLDRAPERNTVAGHLQSILSTFWTSYNIEFEKSFLQCSPWNVKSTPWKDIMLGVKDLCEDPPVFSGIMRIVG